MNSAREPERIQTIVIGGGQAGLSTGYHLSRLGLPFVILDAGERVGDPWRARWDSLRLFSPARYNGLDGMPFPAPGHYFPTKDEMAEYLESYARHFDLPVRQGVRVTRLSRNGDGFLVEAGDQRFEAENVVVAMGHCQKPKVPAFAAELDPKIVQLHSRDYKNSSQFRDGGVLIVGAGNSGAEIALEAVRSHQTWVAGLDTGHVPFRIESRAARIVLIRVVLGVVFRHVLTTRTPIGRKVRAKTLGHAGPLVRVKPKDLVRAGVARVPRVAGIRDGLPVLDDGRVLDVTNVVWGTGYHPGFSWIDLPVFGDREPLHRRGVVESMPGLHFAGLEFQYSFASVMVQGAGRDARHVVKAIATRATAAQRKEGAPAVSVAETILAGGGRYVAP
jgi:putative flavoprotein involved in K+ transport